ncbi:MAG: hypothetical protein WCP98_08130 [Actinomycetes bacterium]
MRLTFRPTASLALVLALICVLLAAVAGAFAPAAAAAPDAAQIDDFLAVHSSPMTGAGATFAAEGREHGVDPAFLVAIAGAESSFGQFLYSENGDQCTFNAFNWFYGATWPQSDFGSWDEAIGRVAEGLAGSLYYGAGLYSVDAIAPRYCPDGTANWVNNVKSFMTQCGGDPADTRLAAGASTPPPDAATLPPDTQPGLIALDGSVTLGGGAREVGRDVSVRFTITNSGGQPVVLEGIRLAVRGPAGASADLVSDQALTLAPGQALPVSASWPLDTVGPWHGWIEVVQNGAPSLVGEKQAFAFRVSLPREQIVRRWIMAEVGLSAQN